ncbi:MAG: hypothetical protein M1351_01460 [Candidatus Thermoplasmatota archaeon]|nr:hypothetical protein [Candidatus Thermoplasmatota archaeon]
MGKSIVSILVVMLLVVSGMAIFATANANASSTSPPPIAQLNKGWIGYDGNYVTVHISGTAI